MKKTAKKRPARRLKKATRDPSASLPRAPEKNTAVREPLFLISNQLVLGDGAMFRPWCEQIVSKIPASKKTGSDLDPLERFALSFLAGVPIKWGLDCGKLFAESAPVGFLHDGEKWQVFVDKSAR